MIVSLLLLGCTVSPPKEGSVLLVTVDGVRADRLGIHGHNPSETPNIDALARTGTKFTRAYATSTASQPALLSLLLGLAPPVHGLRGQSRRQISTTDLNHKDGLFTRLEGDGFSWSVSDWDPSLGPFSGFENENDRSSDIDLWVIRMPPMLSSGARQLDGREYDSALRRYDEHIGQILTSWDAYRPDGHTVLAGVTGSLNGARDDAAVALTDDLLRIPLIVEGPGVEQDWEVVDVVSALDVSATLAKLLDVRFEGHGQPLLTGGSELAYHESIYGYANFRSRPVVGYTFPLGRYEESVFGRLYPASGNNVRNFHIPISEHPAEAAVLAKLRASFGRDEGLPVDAWSLTLDSSECVGLDTLSQKVYKALENGRARAAERMIERLKQQSPEAPIITELERRLRSQFSGTNLE